MTTQPHLTQYVGIYKTDDERWPIDVQPIRVEDRDDFPEPGYLHVTLANGVEFYDAVERISRYVAAGTWEHYEDAMADNPEYLRERDRDMRLGGDYCECGQHYDAHDDELCDMRRNHKPTDLSDLDFIDFCSLSDCLEPAGDDDPDTLCFDHRLAREENRLDQIVWERNERFYASRRRDQDFPCDDYTPYTVRDRRTGAFYGTNLTRDEAEKQAREMNDQHGARQENPTRPLIGSHYNDPKCARCGNTLLGFEKEVGICNDCEYAQQEDRATYQRIDDNARRSQMHRALSHVARVAAFALALLPFTTSAAEVPAFVTNVPELCTVTHVFEDHSAIATCAGSFIAGFDPDDGSWDIPYAISTTRIGPDAQGNYHDWPIWD